MKLTRKVVYYVDLDLTDEQIEAFNIVNSIVVSICGMFPGHLRGLENNENQYQIPLQDLHLTLDTLHNLVNASNFTILKDEEEDD